MTPPSYLYVMWRVFVRIGKKWPHIGHLRSLRPISNFVRSRLRSPSEPHRRPKRGTSDLRSASYTPTKGYDLPLSNP